MLGTDRNTGKPLSGLAHLRQSIADILSTPIGTRIGRRTYGSRLFSLIDAPITAATLNDIYQAAAESIINWEPRIQVTKIKVTTAEAGKLSVEVFGTIVNGGTIIAGIVIDTGTATAKKSIGSSFLRDNDGSFLRDNDGSMLGDIF